MDRHGTLSGLSIILLSRHTLDPHAKRRNRIRRRLRVRGTLPHILQGSAGQWRSPVNWLQIFAIQINRLFQLIRFLSGLLRAKVGVNEALVTLFLNYVAFQILQFVVHGPLRDPNSMGWPMSRALPPGLQVSGIGGTRLHTGLLVAVICALLSVILIRYTRFGIELRSVGMSPTAAVNVGIAVRLYLLASMVVGGALAGLAGYYEIAAVQHRLRTDISLGFGYSGFLVAWMCKGRLWFLFPMSLLVAGLISSSEVLQISTGLPAATADVLEGLLLLFVLVGGSTLVRMSRHKAERQAMEAASGI